MSLSLSSALWRATRHNHGHTRGISIKDILLKSSSIPNKSIRPLSLTATRHRELKSKYADLKMPEESYFEVVWARAEQFKDRTAIVDGVTGRSLDYATAKAQSLAFGSELVRRGAAKDDVMAILLPNCVEYPLVFSGASAAGVINTTLNPIYTPNEIAKQLIASNSTWAVTTEELLPVFKEALTKVPHADKFHIFIVGPNSSSHPSVEELLHAEGDESILRLREIDVVEDLCVLPFSSGTTGVPKGVMLTHRNMAGNIVQEVDGPEEISLIKLPQGDYQSVTVCQLPLYHAFAMNVTMGPALYGGGKIVMMPKFDPKIFSPALDKYKPTFLHLAPPLVSFIANSPMVGAEALSRLEHIVVAAAPSGPSLIAAFKEKAPKGVIYREGWGMTETSPLVTMTPLNDEVNGSCGILIPNAEARVVDISTGEVLGPNQRGELQTKGPQNMKGYFNNPEATAEVMTSDGWLKTGDIAIYDETEHLYIVDRMKELIKVKGFQVAPAEMEDLLRGHPDILDVAVIGIPHEKFGEAPRAYIVRQSGANLEEEAVMAYVKENAAAYKQLVGGIQFMDKIPKSAAGKILRKDLKAEYLAEQSK